MINRKETFLNMDLGGCFSMNKKTDKAYNNKDFLNGKAARPVRVLCELIEPEERLDENNIENTIVFFGSARPKKAEIANQELSEFEKRYKSTDYLKSDLPFKGPLPEPNKNIMYYTNLFKCKLTYFFHLFISKRNA